MKKTSKKPAANAVARCTFHHLAEMTPEARYEIAKWLQRTATFIQSKGHKCSSRFTARFFWS